MREAWVIIRVALVVVLGLWALGYIITGNTDAATLHCVIILMLSQGPRNA